MAPLRADADAQPLLFRELVGLEHRAHARGIDGDRLLGKDVLARFDRRREVHRTESRRRREDDQVDVGGQDLLIRVEACETPVVA